MIVNSGASGNTENDGGWGATQCFQYCVIRFASITQRDADIRQKISTGRRESLSNWYYAAREAIAYRDQQCAAPVVPASVEAMVRPLLDSIDRIPELAARALDIQRRQLMALVGEKEAETCKLACAASTITGK
ncbi:MULTISPECIES: hypothetical protein [Bradyrhizobium]|uniref:Uncharacterized protein n=1 Tax=Bradyrhizobium frederickii TaxID=2560054 RepID=A0A4Y9NSB3_9BRAD|nr:MULTISPECIES: hypothetical protein [Bradyrhizobium]TFV29751.1 hypothetical protein E4K66_37085 [Bradyrhizobium frederickii]TFV70237.1 hypothetical protein E4K64_30750 [Bradyrhizobium frederickii]